MELGVANQSSLFQRRVATQLSNKFKTLAPSVNLSSALPVTQNEPLQQCGTKTSENLIS